MYTEIKNIVKYKLIIIFNTETTVKNNYNGVL